MPICYISEQHSALPPPNKVSDDSPVRIVWKAASTFVESKADVSINDKPFFSAWTEIP